MRTIRHPALGEVGFDGGLKPAIAFAIPPDNDISQQYPSDQEEPTNPCCLGATLNATLAGVTICSPLLDLGGGDNITATSITDINVLNLIAFSCSGATIGSGGSQIGLVSGTYLYLSGSGTFTDVPIRMFILCNSDGSAGSQKLLAYVVTDEITYSDGLGNTFTARLVLFASTLTGTAPNVFSYPADYTVDLDIPFVNQIGACSATGILGFNGQSGTGGTILLEQP